MKYFVLVELVLWNIMKGCFSIQAEQCTDRFMDLSLVQLRGNRIGADEEGTKMDNEIRIVNGIQFTCPTQINSIILGIDIRHPKNSRNMYPSLQLWRPTSDGGDDNIELVPDSERIIVYTPANVSSTGMHEYPLVPPLNANPGDYLAISQPEEGDSIVRVYTVDGGSESSYATTLGRVAVMIDSNNVTLDNQLVLAYPIAAQTNCITSTVSASFVRSQSLLILETDDVDDRRQFLYPDIKFMCNGTIHKWIYSGKIGSGTELPELQVWRQTSDGNYNKQGSSKVSANQVLSPNVYEFIIVNPPIEFKEGDVFGLHQPREEDSGFILYEQEDSGPGNSIFNRGGANVDNARNWIDLNELEEENDNNFPLVGLEISVIGPSGTTQDNYVPSTSFSIPPAGTHPPSVQPSSPVSSPVTTVSSPVTTISSPVATVSSPVTTVSSPVTTVSSPVTMISSPATTVSSQRTNTATPNDISNISSNGFISQSAFIIGVIVAVLLLIITIIVCTAIVVTVLMRRRNVVKNNGGANTDSTDKLNSSNEEQSLSNPIYRNAMWNTAPVVVQNPGNMVQNQGNTAMLSTRPRTALSVPPMTNSRPANNAMYSEINEEQPFYHLIDNHQQQQYNIVVPTLDERRMINNNFKDFREAVSTAQAESAASQRHTDGNYQFLESNSSNFFEESNIYWAPGSDYGSLYEQLASKKYREILSSQISMSTMLGSGNFGVVMKGTWNSPSYGGPLPVAIKTVKDGATEDEKLKFLQEAAIMGQFHHPNIVIIYGVVTMSDPAMIVLELMHDGDLRSFLKDLRPSPGEMVAPSVPELLLGFCRQVASAMEYLANKSFIHRDLAARNVLVTDRKICKISDFGLSRDLQEETYYISKGGQIPIKWTAPEALSYKKYSTASDVWSYGVLMYEIWSLGEKPFQSVTNQQAFRKVCDGYRLPPPPGCPRPLYQIMIECWNPDNGLRPSFSLLVVQLSENDVKLLEVCPSSASSGVHPQASILGGAIEAGEELYPDLQTIYRNN